MIQQTSRDAYHKIVLPEAHLQHDLLMKAYYEHGGMTDREMAYTIGIPPNTVSARRNELVKYGRVTSNGKRKCRVTGITVIEWKAKETLF